MYRKIVLALIACLAMAVPAALAFAEDEGVDDGTPVATDEGKPPDSDILPRASNYVLTIRKSSTIKFGSCDKSPWGENTVLYGTIDGKGRINIPGSELSNMPVVKLINCPDGSLARTFQGKPTGTHDVPHNPDPITFVLGAKGRATLAVLLVSDFHANFTLIGASADCLVGEVISWGKTVPTGKIDLKFTGTYKKKGNFDWDGTFKNEPTMLPLPSKSKSNDVGRIVCGMFDGELRMPNPVTFNLQITGHEIS